MEFDRNNEREMSAVKQTGGVWKKSPQNSHSSFSHDYKIYSNWILKCTKVNDITLVKWVMDPKGLVSGDAFHDETWVKFNWNSEGSGSSRIWLEEIVTTIESIPFRPEIMPHYHPFWKKCKVAWNKVLTLISRHINASIIGKTPEKLHHVCGFKSFIIISVRHEHHFR
jgi:hypothetical protein